MKKIKFIFLVFLIIGLPYVSGQFSEPTTSFQSQPSSFQSYYNKIDPNLIGADGRNIRQSYVDTYWPILKDIESEQCDAVSDFIIMIPPGGCTPPVVRSDLLAEQNVPVFCQLDAIKINPLIDVSTIKSISFKGQYPDEVIGISFHPARAAVRTYDTLLGSPLVNNIGYVVIILKRQSDERNLKEFISGNLTATIYYDAEEAFGVGQAEFYLPVMSDENWTGNYRRYGFWSGRGFLRAEEIEDGKAKISIYRDANRIFKTLTLKEGDTSDGFYYPGFYCRARLKVELNDITAPEKQARLNVDGNEIWVREGSKILNKCVVKQINALQDRTGSISIKCPGESINLILSRKGAVISVDGNEKDVKLGEEADDGWYVGYVGVIPDNIKEKEKRGEGFVLIVRSDEPLSDIRLRDIARKVAEVEGRRAIRIGGIEIKKEEISFEELAKELGKGVSGFFDKKQIGILNEEGNVWSGLESTIFGPQKRKEEEDVLNKKFRFIGFADVPEEKDDLIDDYFNQANEILSELLETYPKEKKEIDRFGETSLWNQIEIAKMIGKQKTARGYLKRFIELYPDAKTIVKAKEDYDMLSQYDLSKAYTNSYVNNEFHFISVNGFEAVGAGQKGVEINIGGRYWSFEEGDKINLENAQRDEEPNEQDYLLVKKIAPEEVSFVYYEYTKGIVGLFKYRTKSLDVLKEAKREGKEFEINDIPFEIEDIRIEKVAKVSLIPEIKLTQGNANFSFKIGIEDRGIQLSPNKTREMIQNLNESLEKWNEINEKMINLIKGWKGACFATSAVMILKNSIFASSGEAVARERVMRGYRKLCDTGDYKGMTKTECYNKLSNEIDRDVGIYAGILKSQSDSIQEINKNNIADRGGLFEEDVVNTENALGKYKENLPESVGIDTGEGIQQVNTAKITSFGQAQAVDNYLNLEKSGASEVLKKQARKDMSDKLLPVWRAQQNENARQEIINTAKLPENWNINDYSEGVTRVAWSGKTATQDIREKYGVGVGDKMELIRHTDNQYYLFTLQEGVNTNNLGVGDRIWRRVGGEFVELYKKEDKGKIEELQSRYTFVTGGRCSNIYLSPEVRFYESEPNAQLPAIVPFDVEEGWYVKVPQSLGGIFGTKEKGYQLSGDVSFFWICNVGENREEENRGGDDICQSFDVNTYESVKDFIECPELSPAKVQELAVRARSAVRQAASQYGKGRNLPIVIQSGNKRYEFKRGEPSRGDGELIECQDFMSPTDCKILFNVCDPVICPPSRCDFGGKIPTADVIQSGIIGSLILCLPNAQEGILVPICMSGVQAGLDSYISVLQAEKDCLQEALNTGRSVGICDEVTAVYECDFFWRQIAPFTNILIPKILQFAYTGSIKDTRGGGEYLSFQQSWDRLGQSLDYFRNYYAQNAFRAFQIRSWEEAGSEFCRTFVGTSFPTSAKAFDSLLEPESPYQFYARFDEVPFTSATVPATSQYKVYYHIYAGRDQGVRYRIYLKNPPATSYYVQNPILSVKVGYIPKGDMADEAIELTAPSGYKELCVDINGKEECGFQQVTTSFALDYLSEKYVKEQVEIRDVKTEKECISGSPSLWGAVNPNIQAGLEEAVEPKIAMRGIVRICARGSPGEATDIKGGRWVDVGYCGEESIRCWLDSESVKGDLDKIVALEGEIKFVEDNLKKLTEVEQISIKDANTKLADLREEIRKLKEKITKTDLTRNNIDSIIYPLGLRLDEIISIQGAYLNVQKAEALGLKVQINQIVVRRLNEIGIRKPLDLIPEFGIRLEREYNPDDEFPNDILTDYFSGIMILKREIGPPFQDEGGQLGEISSNNIITLNKEIFALRVGDDENAEEFFDALNGARIEGNRIISSEKPVDTTGFVEEDSVWHLIKNNKDYYFRYDFTKDNKWMYGGVREIIESKWPDWKEVDNLIVDELDLTEEIESSVYQEKQKTRKVSLDDLDDAKFREGQKILEFNDYFIKISKIDELRLILLEQWQDAIWKIKGKPDIFFRFDGNKWKYYSSTLEWPDSWFDASDLEQPKLKDADLRIGSVILIEAGAVRVGGEEPERPEEPKKPKEIPREEQRYILLNNIIYSNEEGTGLNLEEFSQPFSGYYIKYKQEILGTIVNGGIRADDVFIESLALSDETLRYLKDLKDNYKFEEEEFVYEQGVGLKEEEYELELFYIRGSRRIYYAEIFSYINIEQGRIYAFADDRKIDIGRISDIGLIIMEEIKYKGAIEGRQLKIVEFLNGKQIQGERIVLQEGEEIQKPRRERPIIYLQDEFEFYSGGTYSVRGIKDNYFQGDIINGIYVNLNNIYLDNSPVLGNVEDIGGGYYKIHMIREPGLTYLKKETYDILDGAVIKGKDVFVECRIGNVKAVYSSGGLFGSAGIIFESVDPNCERRQVSVVLRRSDYGFWNPDDVIGEEIISFVRLGDKYVVEKIFPLGEEANFYFEFECKTCNLISGKENVVTPGSEEACKIIKRPYWTLMNGKKIGSREVLKSGDNVILKVEGTGLFCDKFGVELWKESSNGRFQVDKDFFSGVHSFSNNVGQIEYTLDNNKIKGPLSSTYNLFFRVKYGKDYLKTIDSEKIRFSG